MSRFSFYDKECKFGLILQSSSWHIQKRHAVERKRFGRSNTRPQITRNKDWSITVVQKQGRETIFSFEFFSFEGGRGGNMMSIASILFVLGYFLFHLCFIIYVLTTVIGGKKCPVKTLSML